MKESVTLIDYMGSDRTVVNKDIFPVSWKALRNA